MTPDDAPVAECENPEQCTCHAHESLRSVHAPVEQWPEWIALARAHGYLDEAA